MRLPAVRAILEEKEILVLRVWGWEQSQWRGVGALFDFVGVVGSAYTNLANRE